MQVSAQVAGKTLGKYAAKTGIGLSAQALSAAGVAVSTSPVCGPAAPACAVVGGVATAIVFEIVFNEADERLTRPTQQRNLTALVGDMLVQVEQATFEAYHEQIQLTLEKALLGYLPSENT